MVMNYTALRSISAEEEAAFIKRWKPELSKEDYAQVKLLPTYRVWGGVTYGLFKDGELLAVNANSLNKREWPGHGRYIHLYLNFTPPPLRGCGYGVGMQKALNRLHLEQGFKRLDCRVNSVGGLRLQWVCGHMFWGKTEKGELVVDTSLEPNDIPYFVPPKAAALFGKYATPLLRKHLLLAATDPDGIYRLSQEEAEHILRVE